MLAGRIFEARAELAFAFATNLWFDPRLALAAAEITAARSFVCALVGATGHAWVTGSSSSLVAWTDDESSAARLFPRSLATCAIEHAAVREAGAAHGFDVRSVRIELADLGCAMVVVDLRSRGSGERRDLTSDYLDQVTGSLRTAIDSLVTALTVAIGGERLDDWLALPDRSLAQLNPQPPVRAGHIMWVVKTLLIAPAGETAAIRVREHVDALMVGTFDSVTVRQSTYHVGNLISVAVVPDVDDRDARAMLAVAAAMHNWWTGTWLLDALLMAIFGRSEELLDGASIATLDALQDDLARLRRLASSVPARIDTFLLGTTGREYAIWSAIASVWALDLNLNAIARKSSDLAILIDSAAAGARRQRDQRIGYVVAVFTAVSVVASALAMAAFVLSQSVLDKEWIGLRVSIAAVCCAVVAGSFALGYRQAKQRGSGNRT